MGIRNYNSFIASIAHLNLIQCLIMFEFNSEVRVMCVQIKVTEDSEIS